MIENAIAGEIVRRVCLENTQSASRSRGHVTNSWAVLHEEAHVKESGAPRGDQHRLAETEFTDQLGSDGERENEKSKKLE